MKKLIYLIIFGGIFTSPSSGLCQELLGSSESMLEKMDRKIGVLVEKRHLILRAEVGLLYEDQSVEIMRFLVQDKKYLINAFPDTDVFEDVDVRVYLDNGENREKQKQDLSFRGESQMEFTPIVNGNYRIMITGNNFRESESLGRYGIVISNLD